MNYMIETNTLTKQYGTAIVVDKVSLHVPKGKIYGLLGRNGAGKTTVMKMMLQLVFPSDGSIQLFGKNYKEYAASLYNKIGSIIKTPGFYENLTGPENLMLLARLRGQLPKNKVANALEMVGLHKDKKKIFADYSLGMKQRLGIAAAIMHEPELLILDEPINGLDPIGISEIRFFLSKLKNEHGTTVLISSHVLNEIEQIADMIGVMATPCLMFVETLQTHFKYPKRIFTLTDIYDNSLLYMMLLVNLTIYVAIIAYLFSREYAENTLKNLLPIPISRTKLLLGKFCTLFLWIIMLTLVTWGGVLLLSGLYHAVFNLKGYSFSVAVKWLLKFLSGSILMFLTVSPFAYIAQRTKQFVAPVIASSVIVMGSVALANQDLGALYPWTATFFLVQGKNESSGYPAALSMIIIFAVAAVGFFMTFQHFKKEDLK